MDEGIKIKKLVNSLEAQGRIDRVVNNKNLIEYSFSNMHEHTLKGKIILSPNFDVLYMSFSDLTNKHYARGESLEVEDVEKFILNSINERVKYGRRVFGKKFLSIGDIVLDEKIDS